MRQITTQRTVAENGDTIIKAKDCPRACVRTARGAEYPEECDFYAAMGGKEWCNDPCEE